MHFSINSDIKPNILDAGAIETGSLRSKALQRKQRFETQYQSNLSQLTNQAPLSVGELGEKWQFASDHLPIGMTVNDLHIAHWNILDTDYLNYIVDNSQGLKNSLIMEANCPGIDPRLTLREEIILEQVLSLLQHPTHPRSLLTLQETNIRFWTVLQERLPPNYKTVTTFPNDLADGDVFIYDNDRLEFKDLQSQRYVCHPGNTMMSLTLQDRASEQQYRFIQSHVPGGPIRSVPARQEFAEFALKDYDPKMATILMGDMNRSPEDFMQNFREKARELQMSQPYHSCPIPYPTHINTHQQASWIDNFFFAVPNRMAVKISNEETFFSAVQAMTQLLKKLQ